MPEIETKKPVVSELGILINAMHELVRSCEAKTASLHATNINNESVSIKKPSLPELEKLLAYMQATYPDLDARMDALRYFGITNIIDTMRQDAAAYALYQTTTSTTRTATKEPT